MIWPCCRRENGGVTEMASDKRKKILAEKKHRKEESMKRPGGRSKYALKFAARKAEVQRLAALEKPNEE